MRISHVLVLLVVLCLSACVSPYGRYHADHTPAVAAASLSGAVSQIPFRTGSLFVMPDRANLDRFVAIIDAAERRVWLQTYILSEKRTMAALERAEKRGVDVRVSLEPRVYGLPTVNDAAFKRLAAAGIPTVRIRSDAFSLMHAKFLIADGRYWVSTGNMSYSTFTQNREWAFVGDDPTDLVGLESVFRADAGESSGPPAFSGALVVSPGNTRARLYALLDSATATLDVAIQDCSDRDFLARLRAARHRGVAVVAELGGAGRVEENARLAAELSADGIVAVAVDRPYVHAKVVVADGRDVLLGSANFTGGGLDRNREVGLLFRNESVARTLSDTIRADVARARDLNLGEKSGTMEANPSR